MLLTEEQDPLSRIRLRLYVYLLLPVVVFAPAVRLEALQIFAAKAKPSASASPAGEAPKPQLMNADTDPALRYPVAVWESSISCGWLDVTRSSISYSVVESSAPVKSHSPSKFASPTGVQYFAAPSAAEGGGEFQVNKSDLSFIGLVKNFLRVGFARRSILLTYFPVDYCGSLGNKPRVLMEMAQRPPAPAANAAILSAIRNFDGALAEVRPLTAPALDVSIHAEPASVEKGRSVTLIWNSSNATSLDLEPGIGHVAASGGISVTPRDSTTYTLSATGPSGVKTATADVTVTQPAPAAAPTLVLIEPSAAEGQTVEVSQSPLTVRGVVMDALGIPVVTVNGVPASMRPTSAQAAQFTSDPINLQPGVNQFEVVATNSAHSQAKISFVAHLAAASPQAPPAAAGNSKGLSKAEILSLLGGDVPSSRVTELVKERGIKFAPTPDDLKDIRAAGGGDDLVDAITQASSTGH